MEQHVRDYILKLNDFDLVQYLMEGTKSYLPEAVDFAREEFERRRLDPNLLTELQDQAIEIIQQNKVAADALAVKPLTWVGKLLASIAGILVIFAFPLFLLFIMGQLAENAGATRKKSQMWYFACLGLLVDFIFFLTVTQHYFILSAVSTGLVIAFMLYKVFAPETSSPADAPQISAFPVIVKRQEINEE